MRTHKNLLFLLIGDGEELHKLKRKVKQLDLNNICFTGFKENALEYMYASDVYISSSKGEALGYSIIESQMLGIPVIASDVMGHNEIISDGINGLLFSLDDIEKAKVFLIKLIEDQSTAKKMVENGRIKFLNCFKLDNMLTSIMEIYLNILK